ncbi:helix-turn-helix domain-containing protein [Gluconacetobacter asukensis]|uniref:Helix-turn-helix transcriptional regulator n=1 Tax=Gluconacetobacter asukensis TaxID=1017181 RepID=A0A7W4P165_9PROT|nr:helix-turn-helix transcriptional regulator [Gluconacetobacter asukensis]MBB2173637.1 helix-turn-helix transcriptional regulator [Gluconacetobacter asukensis]
MDIRGLFGANVRRLRRAAGLSQEALAERMGVDRAYISWIETGRQNATLLSLWHASQALGVRPAVLLDETHVAATVTPDSDER